VATGATFSEGLSDTRELNFPPQEIFRSGIGGQTAFKSLSTSGLSLVNQSSRLARELFILD
jgi:hypothetical protein